MHIGPLVWRRGRVVIQRHNLDPVAVVLVPPDRASDLACYEQDRVFEQRVIVESQKHIARPHGFPHELNVDRHVRGADAAELMEEG